MSVTLATLCLLASTRTAAQSVCQECVSNRAGIITLNCRPAWVNSIEHSVLKNCVYLTPLNASKHLDYPTVILPLAKIKSHLSVFNSAVLYIMVDQICTFSGENESVAPITTVLPLMCSFIFFYYCFRWLFTGMTHKSSAKVIFLVSDMTQVPP